MDDVPGDTADGWLARGAVEVRQVGDGVRVSVELADPPSPARRAVQDGMAVRVAQSVAAQIAQGLALAGRDRPATFRREGSIWTLAFAGVSVQMTHRKGLLDLRHLLARPGTDVHCLELTDRPADTAGDAPVLDDRARREIRERIRNLQQEVQEADATHDATRAELARGELDQLVEHLSGALGLRGRARQLGSPTERARSTVTWRIRNAIRKIAAVHPRLGRHLDNAVRTGTFCGYEPETPTIWAV
jgi:hypothetical protein